MKNKHVLARFAGLSVAVFLSVLLPLCSVSAQPFLPPDGQVSATDTEDVSATNAGVKQVEPQSKADATQYTQNGDSQTLEEKITIFNQQYCPPDAPIIEISEFNLMRLARAELIKRAELEKYKNMLLVNGKVYVKNENANEKPDGKTDGKPSGLSGKNLIGSFETACQELEDKKIRGKTVGNKKPERVLELKRRKITYRDRDNKLREMELYSPPKFPAKKRDIAGKKGRKVKDYATSILVPKNVDPKDAAAFEEMPSADGWIDDNEAQTQK